MAFRSRLVVVGPLVASLAAAAAACSVSETVGGKTPNTKTGNSERPPLRVTESPLDTDRVSDDSLESEGQGNTDTSGNGNAIEPTPTVPPQGSQGEEMADVQATVQPTVVATERPVTDEPDPVISSLGDLVSQAAAVVATIHSGQTNIGIEGPVWHPSGYLLFSSVDKKEIWKWAPNGAPTLFRSSALSGGARRSNGLTFDPATGDLVVCEDGDAGTAGYGVGRYASQRAGVTMGSRSVLVEQTSSGKRFHGPNDCIVDSQGNTYFTDPWYGAGRGGSNDLGNVYGVYARSASGVVTLLSSDFIAASGQTPYGWEVGKGSPNGLALSPDEKKLYVAATGLNKIFVFTRSAQGDFGSRSVFSSEVAMPDGLKVDAGGRVYVATADGIVVLKPDGTKLGTIALPASSGNGNVGASNVAFGGNDFKTLFATADGNKIYRIGLTVKGARPWQFTSTLPTTLSQ